MSTVSASCRSVRILVVEDEESLTTLLRYNLEAVGYAVETVARGDEAELRIAGDLERAGDLAKNTAKRSLP